MSDYSKWINGTYWDFKPVVEITGLQQNPITRTLEVFGKNFDGDSKVFVVEDLSKLNTAKLIDPSFKSQRLLTIPFDNIKEGNNIIVVSNGYSDDNLMFKFLSPTEGQGVEGDQTNINNVSKWIELNKDSYEKYNSEESKFEDESLSIDTIKNNDIIVNSTIAIKTTSDGIYSDGNSGLAAFNLLRWNKFKYQLNTSFIFKLNSENNGFYLGLCGLESFDWETPNRSDSEMCVYFYQNTIGYQFGGQYSSAAIVMRCTIPTSQIYRLDIENNGVNDASKTHTVSLYVLDSSGEKDRDSGQLIYKEPISLTIVGDSSNIMPFMLGANKDKSELIAVKTNVSNFE